MKKILSLLLLFLLNISIVFAEDLRFVQVTDVRYSDAKKDVFEKVINDINSQNDVDFIVFTGDNIQSLKQDDLKNFLDVAKKLKKPFYVLLGDKDVNINKDLSKKQYAKILRSKLKNYHKLDTNYVFNVKGVVFLVVDGAREVIPMSNGYYKENVLEWIDANLDLYQKNNVIIFQHFPLIPPSENENYITCKPEKYLGIIHNHKNVKAVITGHFGVNKEQKFDEVIHITTAPMPQYRIIDVYDATSENPTIWAEIKEVK